jgi:hypothetical protein
MHHLLLSSMVARLIADKYRFFPLFPLAVLETQLYEGMLPSGRGGCAVLWQTWHVDRTNPESNCYAYCSRAACMWRSKYSCFHDLPWQETCKTATCELGDNLVTRSLAAAARTSQFFHRFVALLFQ